MHLSWTAHCAANAVLHSAPAKPLRIECTALHEFYLLAQSGHCLRLGRGQGEDLKEKILAIPTPQAWIAQGNLLPRFHFARFARNLSDACFKRGAFRNVRNVKQAGAFAGRR